MSRTNWVYILTNAHHTVLYVGSTSNLMERATAHGLRDGSKFARKYNCDKLVWWEEFPDFESAYAFEHKLKRWRRAWKEELISKANPEWKCLDVPFVWN